MLRTLLRHGVGLVVVTALLLSAHAFVTWRLYGMAPPPAGPVAVTVEAGWVTEPQTDDAVGGLASTLRGLAATELYVDLGDLEPASIPGSLEEFLTRIRQRHPNLSVLAAYPVDGETVHQAAPAAAAALLDRGFSGVHLDTTPWRSDQATLLGMLSAVAEVTAGRDAILSTSVVEVEPVPTLAGATRFVLGGHGSFQTKQSLRLIAGRVDRVHLEVRDTAMPTEWLYGSFARRVVTRASEALAGMDVGLLVALPAAGDGRWATHPQTENVRVALQGVRQGLARADSRPSRVGIAVDLNGLRSPDLDEIGRLWVEGRLPEPPP